VRVDGVDVLVDAQSEPEVALVVIVVGVVVDLHVAGRVGSVTTTPLTMV